MEHEGRVELKAPQPTRELNRRPDAAMRSLFLIDDHLIDCRMALEQLLAWRPDHDRNDAERIGLSQCQEHRRGEDDVPDSIEP